MTWSGVRDESRSFLSFCHLKGRDSYSINVFIGYLFITADYYVPLQGNGADALSVPEV